MKDIIYIISVKSTWRIVLILAGFGLFSCGDNQSAVEEDSFDWGTELAEYKPMFGREWNKERVSRGISIIPHDFEIENTKQDYTIWQAKDRKSLIESQMPFHEEKWISYPNGTLEYEEDTYYGREPYEDLVFSGYERITIKYVYNFGVNSGKEVDTIATGFSCHYFHLDHFDVTLEQADSILESWGLRRENYD